MELTAVEVDEVLHLLSRYSFDRRRDTVVPFDDEVPLQQDYCSPKHP